MKVAILGTRGIPNKYGGFEQFAEYFSVGFVAKGYEVTVYCPHLHDFNEAEFKGVKIKKIYCPEDKFGSSAHFIFDYLCMKDALQQQFDILYESGYGTSVFAYYLLNKKSPLIVTNMDGLEWKRSKWNFLTRKLMRRLEKIAVKKSDYIISDNRGIQEYYKKEFNRDSFYIPYGGEISTGFDENILSDYGLKKHGYFVLVARLEPENNIEMILDGYIMSKSKNPFIVIGSPETKYGKFLLEKYKAYPAIKFVGSIYDRAVTQSLRHFSQIYFHGHTVGGTNPSLLEAMGDRAFIIAHDNLFNRGVVSKDNLFFSSKEEIAKHINAFDTYRSLQPALIKANIDRIVEHFNWENVVDSYENLFRKLLRENIKTGNSTKPSVNFR